MQKVNLEKAIEIKNASNEVVLEDLNNFIPKYYELNENKKLVTKETKAYNDKIKEIMDKFEVGEQVVGNLIAKLQKVETIDYNEDILLEILKKNLDKVILKTVVKKKEYVDIDALEKLLYSKKVDPLILEPSQDIKITPKLTVTKAKK